MTEMVKSFIELYVNNLHLVLVIVTTIAIFGFIMARMSGDRKLAFQVNFLLTILTAINYLIAALRLQTLLSTICRLTHTILMRFRSCMTPIPNHECF